MGTSQMKTSPGFSSRMREKFHRPAPLRKSLVEDQSRKYDFVDNESANWAPPSPLVDRPKLHRHDETQLRLACKLLGEKIDRGEISPEIKETNQKSSNTTTKPADPLRHYNTRNDNASSEQDPSAKEHEMPVISEMLRGLENGLHEPEVGHSLETGITIVPHEQQQQQRKPDVALKQQPKTVNPMTRILSSHNTGGSDDENAPQHIENFDPLTSMPTVPDDASSFEGRKHSLMRRISFFSFGKRKPGHSGLGSYPHHTKGAVAVK